MTLRRRAKFVLAPLAMLAMLAPAAAQQLAPTPDPALPLWEVGLFGGAASTPAYPGSEDRSTRALVLPMLIYRGKVLRADRSGAVSYTHLTLPTKA